MGSCGTEVKLAAGGVVTSSDVDNAKEGWRHRQSFSIVFDEGVFFGHRA